MPGQPGCHIRFETAIATELKRCTDQIYAGNVEDRATMAAKLKELLFEMLATEQARGRVRVRVRVNLGLI